LLAGVDAGAGLISVSSALPPRVANQPAAASSTTTPAPMRTTVFLSLGP
jgi:hypothetical protein